MTIVHLYTTFKKNIQCHKTYGLQNNFVYFFFVICRSLSHKRGIFGEKSLFYTQNSCLFEGIGKSRSHLENYFSLL